MLMLLAVPYMLPCIHDAFEDSSEKRVMACQNLTVVKKSAGGRVHRHGKCGGHVRCVPRVCYMHAEGERAAPQKH